MIIIIINHDAYRQIQYTQFYTHVHVFHVHYVCNKFSLHFSHYIIDIFLDIMHHILYYHECDILTFHK